MQSDSSSAPSAVKYRKNYQPSAYLIESTEMVFHLHEENTRVETRLQITPSVNCKNEPLQLDGEELQLDKIEIDGKALQAEDYKIERDILTILQPPRESFELFTDVRINPKANTALSGLYLSSGKFCTQCEAEGFRRITYYLDRPDVLSVFTVKVIGNKEKLPFLLSNGNRNQSGDLKDGSHFVEWHDPFPKPSYLFALVAGDYDLLEDSFTTRSGNSVELQIFVEKGQLDKCDHAMESLKKSMRWDEQRFDREYDLERYMIVAVSDFNMGAMENKGLNVFNTKYVLADKATATDDDFIGVEAVIGHEYFHNWTGNRITCQDWFQLSLKEGLTVFRDQEFTSDLHSRAVKRIQDVQVIRSAQFAEDAGPMAHPIRPDSYIEMNNFYTVTVYNKGAEVIRMYQTLLGKNGFKKGMDHYFANYDGQAVSCEEFISSMEKANNRDLTQFRRWYSQAGTPVVEVLQENWDESNSTFTLRLKQHCPATPGQSEKEPFLIPMSMALITADGEQLEVICNGVSANEFVLEFTEKETNFVFENVKKPVLASLLRDFSAPVKLQREVSNEKLLTLFVNDKNTFSQWDAGQNLMGRMIWDCYDHLETGNDYQIDESFINGFKTVLITEQDPSFSALLIQLPSVSILQADREQFDIVRLYRARKSVLKNLCQAVAGELISLWHSLREKLQNLPEDKQSGLRALANQCLFLITLFDSEQGEQLSTQQFQLATNMTDELAAFRELANLQNVDSANTAIERFYKRWKNEELVMDKWLMVQACTGQQQALSRVQALWNHPVVAHTNPNKVRSLLAGFTMNIEAFHNADGSGYEWFADRITEMDSINPQISARLVSALNSWKKYDQPRQQLIKKQLQKILDKKNLSKDVNEIVSKALI